MLRIQAITKFLEPRRDLVKVYGLLPSIPLDDIHVALLLASIPTLLISLFRLAREKRKTEFITGDERSEWKTVASG
jgi:hypothetical protein